MRFLNPVFSILALGFAAGGCNALLGNEPVSVRSQQPSTDPGCDEDAATCSSTPRPTDCATLACGESAQCVMEGELASCRCNPGFVLKNGACVDQDECAQGNGGCDEHATCVNLPGRRECECKAGYQRAEDSETACVSLCAQAQCDSHASCTLVNDRALCTCLAPYTGNGLQCTFDATCESHHCDQNARCLGGGPTPCVCSDGFEGDGKTCTRMNPCRDNPCQNSGICSSTAGNYSCDCTGTGYRGQRCEIDIDNCTPSPCVHGVCSDRVNGYTCDCAAGYGGQNCEIDIDDCASQSCARGECMDLVHDYKCMCPAGWSGKNCDNNVDNCQGNPCARGTCMDRADGYSCVCPPGYDGVNCENNIDDCRAKPCVHGTCSDGVNAYQCSCPAGYSGKNCETDINECAAKPCQHGGTCTDKVNGFSCACPNGWGGAKCEAGSCAKVSCPASAPCRVPSGNAGMCYPSDCGSMAGLCLAEMANGGGNASTELLTEDNGTFNFGTGNNWNKRSRYFAYVKAIGSFTHVCVFPELNYAGTPIVIPLGQARSMSGVFGQSNAWPNNPKCPKP